MHPAAVKRCINSIGVKNFKTEISSTLNPVIGVDVSRILIFTKYCLLSKRGTGCIYQAGIVLFAFFAYKRIVGFNSVVVNILLAFRVS